MSFFLLSSDTATQPSGCHGPDLYPTGGRRAGTLALADGRFVGYVHYIFNLFIHEAPSGLSFQGL